MVKLSSIKQSNAFFTADVTKSSGLTCVFTGATSGIGASTLEVMVSILHDSTFYILGRSAKKFEIQREKLETLNSSSSRLIFIECDVSLLSDIDAACKQISAEKIDFLYMSQGLVPLNGAEHNSEGLELCFALSYYSRIRLINNLLPLLRKSSQPRILSVLNGGKEKPIIKEDLGLENEANWSAIAAVNHTTACMSLSLDFLAQDPNNRHIIFMHAFPGLVRTNIFAKLEAPESSSYFWWIGLALIRNVVGFLMLVKGVTPEDCGQRQVYHLTSAPFAPGMTHLIDEFSEEVVENPVLRGYRDEGLAQKVWDFTMRVFDRVLDSPVST